MAADVMVMQGDRASAAMILTYFFRNIPGSAPELWGDSGLDKMAAILQTTIWNVIERNFQNFDQNFVT